MSASSADQESDPPLRLALLLVLVAGAVDAVGFLHFRSFYVSFMSGNTTRVGIAAGVADWTTAGVGGAVLASFVLGVALGELVAGVPPRRWRIVLAGEALFLCGAALLGSGVSASLLLAVAMGAHNALVLRAGGMGMSLTYVTGTLVRLGRALAARLSGGPPAPAWPLLASWAALLVGAAAGGASFRLLGGASLLPPAGVLAALAAAGARIGAPASGSARCHGR